MYPVEDREIKNSIIWNWNEKEMSDSIKNQLIELSEVFKFFEIGFHEKTGWFAVFPSSDVYTDLKEQKVKKLLTRVIPFRASNNRRLFNLEINYWGFNQWYKFRWNITHIDLGIISIYNLPQKGISKLFWQLIAISIKPLRWWYHKRYIKSPRAQIKNIETQINWGLDEKN